MFGRGGVASGGSPGSSVLLATETLVNTSGSAQAAGFITDLFGMAFKQGDIPSGTAPIIKIGGVAQAYSWGMQSYWPGGSLKFASFFFRSTVGIAGSSSQAYQVWSGGAVPTTSARTLTEVYAQNLAVLGVGAGSDFGLTGSWGAWLESDANNVEQAITHDGDAGKAWRILTHVADSSGGTGHGQLECYHYVAALTASDGGLGGFRHLARICQPWYDIDSPAKNWRMFSAVSWQYGAGPTTVPLVWPFTAMPFTRTGANAFTTTGANNYFMGSPSGNGNVLPVKLTTTGTLPAGLTTTQVYFIRVQDSDGVFNMGAGSWGGLGVNTTDAGTGTHTITPLPTCIHFGSVFTADVNAKWNFFQGTGSIVADNTVRRQFDQAYMQSTRIIPPYDLSLVGVVDDNPAFSYDWSPISIGPLISHLAQTGETGQLGPIQSPQAIHFYNQSVNSEKLVRIIGLAGAHTSYCFRDSVTRNFPNLSNTSYTGLAAPSAGQQGLWWGNGIQNFTPPPNTSAGFCFDEIEYSHFPQFSYYPYIVTGEPQYLDILMETGMGAMLQLTPGAGAFAKYGRNPTSPYVAYGVVTNWAPQYRTMAWCERELALAAGIGPDAHPDGSQITQYLRAQDAASVKWLFDGNPSLLNAYANTNGLHLVSSGVDAIAGLPPQRHYLVHAVCLSYAHSQDINAAAFLERVMAWDNHVITTFGGYCLPAYYEHATSGAFSTGPTWPIIDDDEHYGPVAPGVFAMSWTTSSPAFSTAGSNKYVPATDDKFIFYTGAAPAGLSDDEPYYVKNVSGTSFDLSETIGGSTVLPSGASSMSAAPFIVPAIHSATACPSATGPDGFLANISAAAAWCQALGITGASTVRVDQLARQVSGGTDFSGDPKYAYQTSM